MTTRQAYILWGRRKLTTFIKRSGKPSWDIFDVMSHDSSPPQDQAQAQA